MNVNKQIGTNNQKKSQGQMTRAFAYALYTPALAPRFAPFARGGVGT
jgi:hypothetical protein